MDDREPSERRKELLRLAFLRGRRMSSATVLYTQAAADAIGMNVSDLLCLGILSSAGPVTAGQLATLMGLTTGAVTGLVDRLEAQGFVRRQRDPHDRRRVLIVMTEQPPVETGATFTAMLSRIGQLYDNLTDEQLELHVWLQEEISVILREEARILRQRSS